MRTSSQLPSAPWNRYVGGNGELALLGWCLMLFDSLWGAAGVLGGMALIGWDWHRPDGIALAVALVSGLPAYMLDLRIGRRNLVFLPALFVFRWIVPGLLATPRAFGLPTWHGSVLLIVASILLQIAKLRKARGL